MLLAAQFLTGLVAVLHLGFLILEMVFWDRPLGRRMLGMTVEYSKSTARLAANQGLYNGFLAAGLTWGLVTGEASVQIFFLVCAVIAGVFGAYTARRTILFVQALPAAIALLAVYFSK